MITWDELDTVLRSVQPVLAATVYPAAALLGVVHGAELHRLGDENVHDVDDYKPAPTPPATRAPRRRPRREVPSQTPIHDTLAAEPMPEVVARRIANVWLEEIGAVEQAKLGIRPRSAAEHYHAAGWGGVPGECGVECACGTTFDGFDTIGEAASLLDRHIAAETQTARDMTGAFPVVRAA